MSAPGRSQALTPEPFWGDGAPASAGVVVAVTAEQLQLLATDGVVAREQVQALQQAGGVLEAARAQARLMVAAAQVQADALLQQAQATADEQLRAREQELLALAARQQAHWLAALRPAWLQALERSLRELCGGALRAEVLAGALAAGAREFETLAGLRIGVAPQDAEAARAALGLLGSGPGGEAGWDHLRLEPDPALAPGSCRLRNHEIEVTLQLERALQIVLGAA